MSQRVFRTLVYLVLLVALAGCNLSGTGSNVPSTPTEAEFPPPSTPTLAAKPGLGTATLPPTPGGPTATPRIAVITPATTPATAAAPTSKLTAAGPWLLIQTTKGLYAANADGSNLSPLLLYDEVSSRTMHLSVSPKGGRIAYTLSGDGFHNQTLSMLTLPAGKVKPITHLTSAQTEPGANDEPGSDKVEALRAITDEPSIAWSPDGTKLGFIGVQIGPSADLYYYSAVSDQIVRLTDGPSQAYGPSWSPDGRYLVQFGVTTFGTGAGYSMVGAWAVDMTNEAVINLYTPNSFGEHVVGWLSPTEFAVQSFKADCGEQQLRAFSVKTLKATSIYTPCFNKAAVDPQTGSLLFTGTDGKVYFMPAGQRKANPIINQQGTGVTLDDGGQMYFVQLTNGQVAGVKTDGGEQFNSPAKADLNGGSFSDGAFLAWYGKGGVWIHEKDPKTEATQVYNQPAENLTWNPDKGDTAFFTSQASVFKAASSAQFKPAQIGTVDGTVLGMYWVKP